MRSLGILAAVPALGLATVALAGSAAPGREARAAAGNFMVRAELRTADGTLVGRATADGASGALRVVVDVHGLAPGMHGAHIHTVGKCDPPDFASAGGHLNPTAHQHGADNPMGPHLGDLPNLAVGADGSGHLEFTIAGAGLGALLDDDGAAMVIHANPDDLKTDPSGNSGPRIACGVFGAP